VKAFNRIFWRIFLAFWLASLTIMFATAYVVTRKLEGAQFLERHQQMILNIAEDIIRRHEDGIDLPRQFQPQRLRHSMPEPPSPFNRGPRGEGLKIVDQQGKAIFKHRFRDPPSTPVVKFELESDRGNRYTVFTLKPRVPTFVKEVAMRFYSLQFILILIASTFVSAILSWSITRPLKALGQFSRTYAQGNAKARIDKKFLRRGDELGDLAVDMDYMTNQVESTLAAQQQLLHDVSHELRAPLARLQASAALLEQQSANSEYTDRLHHECDRINQLIQQILDYSRLNRDNETREQLNIAILINDLINNLKFEFPVREFKCIQPTKALDIAAYPNALAGALDNILRNACKYSPDDSVIEIEIKNEEKIVLIQIRDHGPGVNETEIEKLLKPFYRSGNQMHTNGFGLGLSIAKRALEKHKGDLEIKNHPEGGLVVSCKIPGLSS